MKSEDLGKLSYSSSTKPVDFEKWATLMRLNLESRHSQLSAWWGIMYGRARLAYEDYLQLPPLARSDIRPSMGGFNAVNFTVER